MIVSLFVSSGVVQRAADSICEAGCGDQGPEASEAAVHRGLRDNALRRSACFSLCEVMPGVRPSAAGQRDRAAGNHGLVLQTPHCGQPLRLTSRLQYL